MDTAQCREITRERFAAWENTLTSVHSTPLICIGVGQDFRSGELHVVTVEDIPNHILLGFLRVIVERIERGERTAGMAT